MNTYRSVGKALDHIDAALRHLSAEGVQGFDCSDQTLETLARWGRGPLQRTETLADIQQDLGDCQRCRLAKGRSHIVFGAGAPAARLVFVGEGPGFEEDRQGEPFVGAAGQLLTKIIEAIQMNRQQVYICNIIKCRPPENRNPRPDEIGACFPFLKRQLKAIQPEFICALGTFAAQTLLSSSAPISRLRGRFHDYERAKILPTYHPAYLLRNPEKKRDVWEDMKLLIKEMERN